MIRQAMVFSPPIHGDSDTPRPVLQKHSSPIVNMSETSSFQQQQQQIAVTSSSSPTKSFHNFQFSDPRWDMNHTNQFGKASQSRFPLPEASVGQGNLGIGEVNEALGSDFELRSEKKRKKKEEKRRKKQKKKEKRDQTGVCDSTTDRLDTNSKPPEDRPRVIRFTRINGGETGVCDFTTDRSDTNSKPPEDRPRVIRFTRINGGETGDSDSTADPSDTNSTPPDGKPRFVFRFIRKNSKKTAKIAPTVSAVVTDFTTTISASAIDNATTVSAAATHNATIVSSAIDNVTTISASAIDNATTVPAAATDNATIVPAAATDNATTVAASATDNATLQVTEDAAGTAKKKEKKKRNWDGDSDSAAVPSDANLTPPDCRPRLIIRRSGEEAAKIAATVPAAATDISTTALGTNITTGVSALATNIDTIVSASATDIATRTSAPATEVATRISASATDNATLQVTEDLAGPVIPTVDERISDDAAHKADENCPRTWNLRPRKRSTRHEDDSLPKNKPQGTIRTESTSSEKKPRLWISLSKKEIEEDIYALTGSKPSRKPKKRPKNVQKQLDDLFPGLWIGNVSLDTYKV